MKNVAVFAIALVVGCANPINERTAVNYYEAGEAALARGDLPHAREMFSRALINARLGHMGERAEVRVLSKLGRVNGNLCEYDAAEKLMLEARDLDIKANVANPVMTFPTRLELAQFSYDIGRYEKAVTFYDEALAVGGKRLKEIDSATYNAVMKDYADALAKTGNSERSKMALAEAATTPPESAGTAKVGKGSDYVRYPKTCK